MLKEKCKSLRNGSRSTDIVSKLFPEIRTMFNINPNTRLFSTGSPYWAIDPWPFGNPLDETSWKSPDTFSPWVEYPRREFQPFGSSVGVFTNEDDNFKYVEVDLPGVKKEDIAITYEKNEVIITAKRMRKDIEEQIRKVCLVTNVNITNSEATYENGVLVIKLPKTDKENKLNIKIV